MNTTTQKILKNSVTLSPSLQEEVLDFINFLLQKQNNKAQSQGGNQPNGVSMAKIMEKIAQRGMAFHAIQAPIDWQRETRKDHPFLEV